MSRNKSKSDEDEDWLDDLCRLVAKNKYPELLAVTNRLLRKYRSDPYNAHIIYGYRALSQMYLGIMRAAKYNANQALIRYPTCPWTMWIMALVLEAEALETNDPGLIACAIESCCRIVETGAEVLGRNECIPGTSKTAAMELVNDSHFLLGFLYKASGNVERAKNHFEKFLAGRRGEKLPSWFTIKEAQDALRSVCRELGRK